MRSAQGLRDQTRVTGHGGAGRATFSAPRACPAAAGRGAQVTATARPSSRTRAPAARAQYARPAPSHAGPRRGRLWRRGREMRAPPDSRLYSAISLFNAVPAIPRNLRSAASPHPRRSRPVRSDAHGCFRVARAPGRKCIRGARAGDVARRGASDRGSLGFASRSRGHGHGHCHMAPRADGAQVLEPSRPASPSALEPSYATGKLRVARPVAL